MENLFRYTDDMEKFTEAEIKKIHLAEINKWDTYIKFLEINKIELINTQTADVYYYALNVAVNKLKSLKLLLN